MKRLFCILLVTILVTGLWGCDSNQPRLNAPVEFYYCYDTTLATYTMSDGVVASEQRESTGYEDTAKLLDLYLQGPLDPKLRSPFPAGITVIQLALNETVAEIALSQQLADLSGYDLTLACACLAMTVMELTQAEAVQISAEDKTLWGNPFIMISKDQLVFLDTGATEAME